MGPTEGHTLLVNLRVSIKKVFSEAWTSKQKPPAKKGGGMGIAVQAKGTAYAPGGRGTPGEGAHSTNGWITE